MMQQFFTHTTKWHQFKRYTVHENSLKILGAMRDSNHTFQYVENINIVF